MVDRPERKILNVADPHFSRCGGPTREEEQCNSLCGRPKRDGKVNLSSQSCQDFGSSDSYGYKGRKVADPPERKFINVANPHLSECGVPTCEGE